MIVRALVLRPIVREKIRTALTVAGIAVGVAVVVAIQLANQSALRAFRESIDAIAGRANYQISADAGMLDEKVLLSLQRFWGEGIRFAPVIDVEGVIEPSQQPVRMLAVDLLSDLHFRDYRYARIELTHGRVAQAFQAAPAGAQAGKPALHEEEATPPLARYFALFGEDAVVVPEPFARERRLDIGSPLQMNIGGATRTMTVRGILQARGPATAFNGAIVVADIATAQKSFGMAGRLSRVDLIVPEDRASRILPQIRSSLPSGVRIERPSRRNDRVEKMLRAFRVNLFALAGVALLVGMFLVYNTVLISILRRRRDVGIARTLGVSSAQIFRAFLVEGLLFGFLGSIAGIALGVALAQGILKLIGRTVNALYITSRPEAVSLTPGVVVVGVLVGVVLSLVSAIQPSIEASRVAPTILIRAGLQQRVRHVSRRRLAWWAAGSFAAAAAIALLPPIGGVAVAGYVSVLFVVIGFSLLAPIIVRATSAMLTSPMRTAFGMPGHLAAASMPASLRRTSVASAALSLAIGMMVAVALMVGSFRVTVNSWIGQTVTSDLWLRPARGLTNTPSAVFPPQIVEDLRRFDFIEAVDPVRGHDVVYGDSLIAVGSGAFRVTERFGSLPMLKPRSARAASAEALKRNGVFVSETFSLKYGKSVGDEVSLPTMHGTRAFPIVGIYRDYSSDRGTVVMDRELYVRMYDDRAINTVVIFLRKGADLESARAQLEAALGPKYHAFAITNASIRREVMSIFDQTFLITYALLGVAIVVAVLGIVNTLSALILERTRELALLRVGGMSRRQLDTMIVLESALLGISSTAVGLVMGYVLSWILIYVINRQSFGWTIEFHTPVQLIAASLFVTFLASVFAGLIPARIAARIDIAGAIKSE